MLNYEIVQKGDYYYLTLTGKINEESVTDFQKALDDLLSRQPVNVIFNFKHTNFINSAGLGKFLLFYKRVKGRNPNASISISGIGEDLYNLFKEMRLHKLINIEED